MNSIELATDETAGTLDPTLTLDQIFDITKPYGHWRIHSNTMRGTGGRNDGRFYWHATFETTVGAAGTLKFETATSSWHPNALDAVRYVYFELTKTIRVKR